MDKTPLFDLFWENAKLNSERAVVMSETIAEDAGTPSPAPRLEYSDEAVRLPMPRDKLQDVLAARRSVRLFAPDALTLAHLGGLFAGLAATADGRRVWPSGGAKYSVEAYAMLLRAPGGLAGRIVYYNADGHSFSSVGPCPDWAELAPALSFNADPGPAAVVVLAAFPSRSTIKYGERGARLVLLEGGACMQNLSLRAAQGGLAGVLLGGLHDETIKEYLGLQGGEAIILGGYACGLPVGGRGRAAAPGVRPPSWWW
jgi:SagB-type dehydrogenase family enzyme